jgi:hypothetical protein
VQKIVYLGGINMKRKIELKGNKVLFITETDDLKRTEEVPKTAATKLYKESKEQKEQYLADLNRLNKRIKELDIKTDKELEKFIELADRAAKYNEFKKATEQADGMLDFVNRLNMQIEDLEKAIPELKRAPKK